MKNLLMVVDKNDKVLSYKNREICHQSKGLLHRAVSIFIFNKNGQLLLQKRSSKKLLWPLFWSNSCCTHHKKGEQFELTAAKRLKEELGISCPLKFLEKAYYQFNHQDIGSEHEITYIFIGKYDGKITPNPQEVESVK